MDPCRETNIEWYSIRTKPKTTHEHKKYIQGETRSQCIPFLNYSHYLRCRFSIDWKLSSMRIELMIQKIRMQCACALYRNDSRDGNNYKRTLANHVEILIRTKEEHLH